MSHIFFFVLCFFTIFLARWGFVFISALMASSKLNGKSDTGFALGIGRLQMASVIGRSSLRISSEHVSAGACSASCYDRLKDVRIRPIVMPKRKFRQVQRQIRFADVVE